MKSESDIKFKFEPRPLQEIKFWRPHKPVVDLRLTKDQPLDELVRVAKVCPHGAIEASEKTLKINYNICDGCLICLRECHFGAIKEEKE